MQAGAFVDKRNAHGLRARLEVLGPARVLLAWVNGRRFHRVRMGPLPSLADARALRAQVAAAGMAEARIVRD